MSMIHTCELNGANPVDYLTELQRHAEELQRNRRNGCLELPRDTGASGHARSGVVGWLLPWPKRIARKVLKAARRWEIDLVLVWRLGRWGRSVTDLLATLQELDYLGVGFVSLPRRWTRRRRRVERW
jgi:hypothetical protein